MSTLVPAGRELVAFAGPVHCEAAEGAVNLVLRGAARATPGAPIALTQLLFSGAAAVAMPRALRDARVIELASPAGSAPGAGSAPRRFRIDSPQLTLELQARSVQLHREAAAQFFAAVPPPRVPLPLRLGWWLLLTALRIPGAGAVVRTFRGSA